jgi:Subtilase family
MASDPNKPLLRVEPRPQVEPRAKKRGFPQSPEKFSAQQQLQKFGPKFDRLRDVLARDPQGLSLRADPDAMAPERLLVFELRGSVDAFAAAVSKVDGRLEFIDEEALAGDDTDKEPVAYLLVPDMAALRQIESLWRRWNTNENLGRGFTPWRDVFALLRDLRRWGPQDRVDERDSATFSKEIEGLEEDHLLRLEIELVFRDSDQVAQQAETAIAVEVQRVGGAIVSWARIKAIGYHACLVDLPVSQVRAMLGRTGVAALETVMHIRPQSMTTTLETEDAEPLGGTPQINALGEPILALLDGVPVANHPLLAQHVSVDDPFGLEALTAVADRKHGTAMASLIVHGDRNRTESPLPRKIHMLPVMMAEPGRDERFPSDRLIVDVIYQAVRSMRAGADASAPEVLIVNLSLGNPRQPFHQSLSAWAKLLDRLAYEYGILFVVSAGNVPDEFIVPNYATRTAFEDADPDPRAKAVLGAVGALMAQRRLFAPAETVNGITVGACNQDDVHAAHRATARTSVEPYSGIEMVNPSSALGPGYGAAVKPDILMPGSRERLLIQGNTGGVLRVQPSHPSKWAGLKVAAPPQPTDEQFESYTNGTSAAAALASRTCHRIHDALEAAYGDAFLGLTHRQRAVLLKALLTHTAQWPQATAAMIRDVLGPSDGRQHIRQKDNIRRFLGYGIVDAEAAIACADDRATFWATGEIAENQVMHVPIPIPLAMANKAQPHALVATAAWFTPTKPGNRRYRAVRLKLLKPDTLGGLGLEESFSDQPDQNQVNRGTLYHQRWYGERVAAVADGFEIALRLQREPDQAGMVIDEPIPFAVAVTLTMPGVIEIYEQVRQRLGIPLPTR